MKGLLRNLVEKRSDEDMQGLVTGLNSLYGSGTNTGLTVTTQSAERITAVLSAVRIYAESMASLPLDLLEIRGKGRYKATHHPLYDILHTQTNPEMSSWNWREAMVRNLALTGNCYSEIVYDNSGDITALWPLWSESTSIWRDQRNGMLWYMVELPASVGGGYSKLRADQIFHVRMFSRNGITGRSWITYARESLGLALATEESGARFFQNGSQLGVVLEHPNKLDDASYKHLLESWAQAHEGLGNAYRAAILEEGMKANKIGVTPEEAQFLETRKFQVTEIARIFRLPPHMIGDLEKATFSNIEQQSLEFVVYSLMPWLTNFEQAIDTQLLTRVERRNYYAKFIVSGLLRGDTPSRYSAYAVARQNGWMSANEIRELEDMNPRDGGDSLLVPLNMVPADQNSPAQSGRNAFSSSDNRMEGNQIETRSESLRSLQVRKRLIKPYRKLYEDTAKRLIKRESQDVIALARKAFKARGFSQLLLDLDAYYRDEFKQAARRMILPVAMSYGELVGNEASDEIKIDKPQDRLDGFLQKYVEVYAQSHAEHSLRILQDALRGIENKGSEPISDLENLLDGWNESRATDIALEESIRLNNAVAHTVYAIGGVERVQWSNQDGDCAFCSGLDGRSVGIDEIYFHAGDDYRPDGSEETLKIEGNVGHPPLHRGCECLISAVMNE